MFRYIRESDQIDGCDDSSGSDDDTSEGYLATVGSLDPQFERSDDTGGLIDTVYPSGIGPQANILPSLSGIFHPILRSPPHSESLLL